MQNINIIIFKILNKIKSYNLTIFIVLIVIALISAVFSLTKILEIVVAAPAPSTSTTYTEIKFDQTTIDKIEKLKTSGQAADTALPSGRINPFAE